MKQKFKVIHVGLGPMGLLIVKLLIERINIELVGIVDIAPHLIGKQLPEILDIPDCPNLTIETDLQALLSLHKPDIVMIATSSSLLNVAKTARIALKGGANVISLCEELSYPQINYPEITSELNSLAKSQGLTITGTGINPGYLMDLLPIVLTAPCQTVNHIKVIRMMNSAYRREPFQRKIGTGLSVDEFNKKISERIITGHVGLRESIQMIVHTLDLEYDEIVENPPSPVKAGNKFKTSYNELIREGDVCGLKSTAYASINGKKIVELDFIAYSGDHSEYDSIEISGKPNIIQKIEGGVHGDIGTAAMATNLIPIVVNAPPGLRTMKDLPVPFNTEKIFKS